MRRGQVREQLMASAGRLVAEQGLGALSLRAVVREAGANLNSVNYHFGSRDGLLSELAERAQGRLNQERFAELDALPTSWKNSLDAARGVLGAAYGPLFRQALGPGSSETRPGLLLIQQLRFDPSGLGQEVLEQHAGPFVQRVEQHLGSALACGAPQIRTRMQLANAAAWDMALRPDTLTQVQGLKHQARGVRRLLDRFVEFGAAGLVADNGGA